MLSIGRVVSRGVSADQRFLPNDGLMRHTLWCGMGLSENAGQRSWRHPASSLLLLLLLARLPIKRIPERATGPSSSSAAVLLGAFPGGRRWQRTQLPKLPPGTAGPAGPWRAATKVPLRRGRPAPGTPSTGSPSKRSLPDTHPTGARRLPSTPAQTPPELRFSALELAN